jgi:hypothetical protein
MAVDWLVKAGLDLTQIDNDIKQLQAKMQAAGITPNQLRSSGGGGGGRGGGGGGRNSNTAAVAKSQKSDEAHDARMLSIRTKYGTMLAVEEDRLKRIALRMSRERDLAKEIVHYRMAEGDSAREAVKAAVDHLSRARETQS